MNFYAVSALINFVASITLGSFVLSRNSKSRSNIGFALFTLCTGWWSISYYFWQISNNAESALFWSRSLMAGAIFITITYLYFICSLLGVYKKKKYFLWLGYSLFFIFFILDFTPLFVSHIESVLSFKFWPIAGPVFAIFLAVWIFYASYGAYLLAKYYTKSKGTARLQIKYLLIGTVIGYVGGITNYFLWYKIPIVPFGNISTTIYLGIVAYAIVRYRLMDIRIVVRKTVIYFFSAAFIYGAFYLTTWICNKFFGGVYAGNTYLLGIIVAPLFVVLFIWINDKVRKFANKYLFFDLYTNQETIEKLTDELTNSINLNKIVDSIVDSIKQAMQLDRAGILLISQSDGIAKYKIAKVIGFNENNGISLVQDNFLTQHLEKTQKPLVRDELQIIAKNLDNTKEKQSFDQLAENMKHIEASLCLPMIISNKLIGIIVLGSKTSGDAYTSEDLTLLSTLSKQAAIAVDNARLYKEVQDFSKTLQQKVDEQTKEIKNALLVEKQAHKDLIKLDEAKTNFMLVTQHHLRTPLTITAGYVELLQKGRYGKLSKKTAEAVKIIDESIRKEMDAINDLLAVSAFQLGHGYIRSESGVSVKKILKDIIRDLKPAADSKNLYLKFDSVGDTSDISGDSKQLKMALQNIIDNAIKYTKEGGVTVKIGSRDGKIKIEVIDTGIGINDEDQGSLFGKPFLRTKEAWIENATGKGIGAYLSAQIIRAHGGEIRVESDGEGKGSIFIIEFPIN